MALGAFAVRAPAAEPDSLQSVNQRAIENALARCEGRIEGESGAARFLGLHPATLRSRMLGIEWSRFRIAR